MSITRKKLSFERNKNTTEIPRAWLRDKRLGRRARGLLGELLTHAEGWNITITALLQNGPEKRDALNTAIAQLEQYGYLTRTRGRSAKGTFEVDYDLSDPFEEPVDKSSPAARSTSAENPDWTVLSAVEKSALKKDPRLKEEINQSSGQRHLGAVDNFSDDDKVSPLIHFPTPSNVAKIHPRAIDRSAVAASVGHFFIDSGISDDQLHAICLMILGRATAHVTDPTQYVIRSIRNDAPVWQKYAFEMMASTNHAGGF